MHHYGTGPTHPKYIGRSRIARARPCACVSDVLYILHTATLRQIQLTNQGRLLRNTCLRCRNNHNRFRPVWCKERTSDADLTFLERWRGGYKFRPLNHFVRSVEEEWSDWRVGGVS